MTKPGDVVLDKRTIERNIKHGGITRKDVEKMLSSLPDVTNKGITLGEIIDRRERAAARRRDG